MPTPTVRGAVRTAFITEYALLRRPLGALDRQVLTPVCGADSRVRRWYSEGLARLDALVTPADAAPAPADETFAPDSASSPSAAEVQHEIHRRAEELLARQENETFVGELADESVRRAQAEVEAKQEVEDDLDERAGSDPR